MTDNDTSVGSCSSPVGQTITCSFFGGAAVAGGDEVEITFNGVTNPSAGSYTIDVSTTSDTSTATSPSYSVAPAGSLTGVSLDNTTPSDGAEARTQYVAQFTVSATGGMSQAANSRITVTFPAGTTFGGYTGGGVVDVTDNDTSVGSCSSPVGQTITCSLFGGAAVAGGDQVEITFNGVTNPSSPGSSYTVDVSTTSDTAPVTSSTYSVAPAGTLTNVSLDNADPSDGADARTRYVARFTTSATGGMSQRANSHITVVFPSGTGFVGYTGGAVRDVTANQNVGSCSTPVGLNITCSFFGGDSVPGGNQVEISFNGVTNNASPGSSTPSTSRRPPTPRRSRRSPSTSSPPTS